MKRKTLTIVSIVSIIIISLILLGITYGYFLTNITGNENSKSVEVVTGDSKVLFTDLSTSDISETIEPGYKTVKSFTVQNTGDVSATYSIYLVDVVNDFNRIQDITYNLYKKAGTITDVTIETDLSETAGWTRVNEDLNVTFPTTMSVIAANEKIQNPNEIYTYVLKVEYIDHPTENQNEDQGKTFAFKVNLRAEDSYTNPFSEKSLAYSVLDNIQNGTLEGKTTFIANLDARGMVDNVSTADDKILSSAQDDWGTTYYFRGNPIDNYVEYAEMCWRIVRVQGDGSIKLILASELSCSQENLTSNSGMITDGEIGTKGNILPGHYGYKLENGYYIKDYINSPEENEFSARVILNNWLNRKINEEQQQLLKTESWCIANTLERYYSTKIPSYVCNTINKTEEIDQNKIGMLTFDEVVYAGGGRISNSNYYLNNNANSNWNIISPGVSVSGNYTLMYVSNNGDISTGEDSIYTRFGLRSSVTLKPGVQISKGKGIVGDPYVIG